MSEENRAIVLLRATLDILQGCAEGPFVKEVQLEKTVWGGKERNGGCLMKHIKEYLEEEGES